MTEPYLKVTLSSAPKLFHLDLERLQLKEDRGVIGIFISIILDLRAKKFTSTASSFTINR